MWKHLWVRGLVTLVSAVLADALSNLIHFKFVWGGGFVVNAGVLDFAGGAVIHVNSIAPLTIIWLVAEMVAWKTRGVAPLGSYLAFVFVFTLSYNLILAAATGFISGNVMIIFVGIALLVAAAIAWLAAALYASLRHRRIRPPVEPIF